MGLAVLPARLRDELGELGRRLAAGEELTASPLTEKHAPWAEELKKKYAFTPENAEAILQKEVGEVFKTVLEHAGVFKRDAAGREAFLRFAESVK